MPLSFHCSFVLSLLKMTFIAASSSSYSTRYRSTPCLLLSTIPCSAIDLCVAFPDADFHTLPSLSRSLNIPLTLSAELLHTYLVAHIIGSHKQQIATMKTITLKGKAGKSFQAKLYATFTHTIDGHDHKFMLTRVSTGVNPELKEISITEQTGASVAKFNLCPPSKYSQFTYLCCEFELYVGTLSDTRGMIAFAEALLDEVIHKHGATTLNKKLQALRN